MRAVLAAMSLFILFSFNDIASDIVSIGVVLGVIAYWIVVRRKIVASTDPPGVVVIDPALAAAPISNAPLGRMS